MVLIRQHPCDARFAASCCTGDGDLPRVRSCGKYWDKAYSMVASPSPLSKWLQAVILWAHWVRKSSATTVDTMSKGDHDWIFAKSVGGKRARATRASRLVVRVLLVSWWSWSVIMVQLFISTSVMAWLCRFPVAFSSLTLANNLVGRSNGRMSCECVHRDAMPDSCMMRSDCITFSCASEEEETAVSFCAPSSCSWGGPMGLGMVVSTLSSEPKEDWRCFATTGTGDSVVLSSSISCCFSLPPRGIKLSGSPSLLSIPHIYNISSKAFRIRRRYSARGLRLPHSHFW